MLLQLGSNVIITKGKIPGIIISRNDEDAKWEVEFEKKNRTTSSGFYTRWQLRNSKAGDINFESKACEKPIEFINKRVANNIASNSDAAEKSEDEDVVDFPLPDYSSSSESSSLCSDDSNDSPKILSAHEQCKRNSKKPIDDRKVPFGKHVLVVILKGDCPGMITKAKGPKT